MSFVTIVAFLTMITLLVAAHELGHYLFARLFRMGVEEFAIGFGKKPLFTYARKTYKTDEGEEETTDFTVRPWPLGGFVRIKGMIPDESGNEIHTPGGFYSKPAWQRIVVLIAGPAFSVLAGFAILVPVFMVQGIKVPVNKPILATVGPDGPAARAGLKGGDEILSLDGKKVGTFYEMITIVREKAEVPIQISFRRDGDVKVVTVTPQKDTAPTPVLNPDLSVSEDKKIQGKLSAGFPLERKQLGFAEAFDKALKAPVEMVKSLVGIATLKRKASDELGGPLTMFNATKETVESGFGDFLTLSGLLSISLGIFNLLPVPPLDGGQILVAFAEMLRRGRRLSMKVQEGIGTVGFSLILLLIASILVIDFKRFVFKDPPKPAKVESK